MKILCDCHFHTISSGHAYSTLAEYAQEAAGKGLELIAITDHGPKMPGSAHPFFFHNLRVLPPEMNGVRLLKGIEANVLDVDGQMDMPDADLEKLDWVLASAHLPCMKSGTIEENTKAMIAVMKKSFVHAIGHPDDSRIPMDADELARAAVSTGTLIEMNNSSLLPTAFRIGAQDNYLHIMEACVKHGAQLVVNTDAHIRYALGDFDAAISLLESVGFPEELIANTSAEKLLRIMKK